MSDIQSEQDDNLAYKLSRQKVSFELEEQENAYVRLNALYTISKLLSEFGSIEATFPVILASAAKTFPLLTAVLVDNWEKRPKTTIWHSELASHEQVIAATLNARETFSFLKGTSSEQSTDLAKSSSDSTEFNNSVNNPTNENPPDNYIVIPLVIDKQVIGALQLEGGGPLQEKDLQFVVAFANLIAITLDRYYKTRRDHELQTFENSQHSARFADSQNKIADLESERDLREGFVSLLTHDLRTPLAAAKMAAQLILKQGDDRAAIHSLAERIENNVSRADRMISNLLDANRLRSGEIIAFNLELFDLSILIQEILQELKMLQGDRFFFNPSEEVLGYWNKKEIQRVLENLLSNATKYGDPKEPITISLAQNNQNVIFAVQNFGDIISPEDQKSIFTQYRRTSKAQAGNNKGWGIGLTLVKGVVEAHGGRVTVKSDIDSGTVFTVTLPKDARNHKTTKH